MYSLSNTKYHNNSLPLMLINVLRLVLTSCTSESSLWHKSFYRGELDLSLKGDEFKDGILSTMHIIYIEIS
jgi:hypothetical protein